MVPRVLPGSGCRLTIAVVLGLARPYRAAIGGKLAGAEQLQLAPLLLMLAPPLKRPRRRMTNLRKYWRCAQAHNSEIGVARPRSIAIVGHFRYLLNPVRRLSVSTPGAPC